MARRADGGSRDSAVSEVERQPLPREARVCGCFLNVHLPLPREARVCGCFLNVHLPLPREARVCGCLP
jgi:hypothetical protein